MTTFVRDVIETDMTIGGEPWHVVDLKVELSRNTSPNYVDIKKMAPKNGIYFDKPEDLVGQSFELSVDTELESYRDAPGKYNSTIFKGAVANISSLGTGAYEAIIYDPSQQALNTGAKGSVLNQKVSMTNPTIDYTNLSEDVLKYASKGSETTYSADTTVYRASDALKQALNQTEVSSPNSTEGVDIQLSKKGKVVGGGRGQFRGALDVFLKFDKSNLELHKVLEKLTKETKSFWWFDREGVFHFGVPDANVHNPELITDTSAGLTTPPYQSVKIVGSDVATSNGYAQTNLNPDEPLIMGANITIGDNAEPSIEGQKEIKYGEDPDLNEPTFVYRSQEIITRSQAQNALEKIAQDLGEQYASGKITTVGFPEPSVFDVMIMPHGNSDKKDKGNYQPNQPMGGSIFGLYKVVHKINSSDGFKTEFSVAGMTTAASVITEPDDFLKNPEKRATAEKEGTEFEGIESPPTAEDLREQGRSNAIAELVEKGFAGSANEVRAELSPSQSAIEVAQNFDPSEQTEAEEDGESLQQAPRGFRPDDPPAVGVDQNEDNKLDWISDSVGDAIDTVFGGVAEKGEQNPYTYR